jgi:hypothetical protein
LDEVRAALARAGISNSAFTGVRTIYGSLLSTTQFSEWSFQLSAPLTNLTNVLAQLTAGRTRIGTGFTHDVDFQSLEVSEQGRPVCRLVDLLTDAKAHAQRLATNAGVTVGPIANIGKPDLPAQITVPTVATRTGDFAFAGSVIRIPVPIQTPQYSVSPTGRCSLSVQFQLR